MNRRGFFALVGAACAAPKAVNMVAPVAKPIELSGISAWLPDEYTMHAFPMSPCGRLEYIAEALEEGWITQADAMKLTEAV